MDCMLKMPYAFMLLNIYCVKIWFFLCLLLVICEDFSVVNFLTMVLHFVKGQEIFSSIFKRNKVFWKVNTASLGSLQFSQIYMGPEIYPLCNFNLCAELWVWLSSWDYFKHNLWIIILYFLNYYEINYFASRSF